MYRQNTGSSPPGKVADVQINPNFGDMPISVFLSTTTATAHIFYVIYNSSLPQQNPVHNGDNAVPPTIRIGSNSGSVSISNTNQNKTLRAVGYQPTLQDSNITEGDYLAPGPGG